jgi:predicted transcriptional regulator
MTRKLYEIAADIIEAQATIGPMTPDALEQALSKVFITLQRMKMAEEGGVVLDETKPETPAEEIPEKFDPKSSIQENKVICLECRAEMKQLTAKHMSSHGLTIREYKTKWGFPQRQSLSAISLSKARSKAAKKRGLPENLLKFQEQRKLEKMKPAEVAPATRDDKGKTKPQVKRRPKKKAK